MSKRSNFTEFDKETRKYIKKRDKDKCVICGAKGGLQIRILEEQIKREWGNS